MTDVFIIYHALSEKLFEMKNVSINFPEGMMNNDILFCTKFEISSNNPCTIITINDNEEVV